MITFFCFGVVLLTVLLAGGRLGLLADVRISWVPLLWVTMVVQALLTTALAPHPTESTARAVHLATYAAGAAVLVRNLRLPGLWLVAAGGAMNIAAIVANGGVMPARPGAVVLAGLDSADHFVNSAPVDAPRLAPLGDVFAVPEALPLSNVFSVGDVLLLVGVGVFLHSASRSRWFLWVCGDAAADGLPTEDGPATAVAPASAPVDHRAAAVTLARTHVGSRT